MQLIGAFQGLGQLIESFVAPGFHKHLGKSGVLPQSSGCGLPFSL